MLFCCSSHLPVIDRIRLEHVEQPLLAGPVPLLVVHVGGVSSGQVPPNLQLSLRSLRQEQAVIDACTVASTPCRGACLCLSACMLLLVLHVRDTLGDRSLPTSEVPAFPVCIVATAGRAHGRGTSGQVPSDPESASAASAKSAHRRLHRCKHHPQRQLPASMAWIACLKACGGARFWTGPS